MTMSLVRKSDREIDVFKQFVGIAGWEIDPDSIEKKEEKHTPDIHFRSIGDGPYAVELVELVNPIEANGLGWQHVTRNLLETAHDHMPVPQREAFDRRFGHALLWVAFRGRPSKASVRSKIGDVFAELLALPDGVESELSIFQSKGLSKILVSIGVSFGNFNGPIFSVENILGVGDPITESIRAKLDKEYNCEVPVDLVAYLDVAAMHPPQIWRGPLQRLTSHLTDCGRFRRIWVVDLRRGTIEFVTGSQASIFTSKSESQ